MAENNKEKEIELEENEIMRVILKKVVEEDGEKYHCELQACFSNKDEDSQMIREAILQLCKQMGVMPGFTICFPRYSDSEGKSESEEKAD